MDDGPGDAGGVGDARDVRLTIQPQTSLRPLKTSELADRIGVSTEFIRSEIKAGRLKGAYRIGCGRCRQWGIPRGVCRRYAASLGVDLE